MHATSAWAWAIGKGVECCHYQQLSVVVKIEKAKIEALTDTGATSSLIAEKLAGSPEIAGKRVATRCAVNLDNGSHTESRAILQTSVSFGDKEKTLNLQVMPGLGDSVMLQS